MSQIKTHIPVDSWAEVQAVSLLNGSKESTKMTPSPLSSRCEYNTEEWNAPNSLEDHRSQGNDKNRRKTY